MKQQDHYPSLDGLRGFAAVSVVLFHLGHWLDVPWLASNSGLAVDFFFCLSGFVLPLAYGNDRNRTMSTRVFLRIRLIRLIPLIIIATFISGAYVLARLSVTHQHGAYHSLALAYILGTFTLPYLNAPTSIGGPLVFPLDGPQYTLFLELLINFLWFPWRGIYPLAGSILVAIICVAGLAAFGSGGDTTASFWHGFPRVGASFFAGIAIFELTKLFQIPISFGTAFWPLCIIMALLFYFPHSVGVTGMLFWVVVLAPLLVLSGSKIVLAGWVKRLCLFGGEISYPIYVLQYPIFCWANGVFQTVFHKKVVLIEVPLIFAAIILLSALMLQLYDKPIRLKLSKHYKKAPLAPSPNFAS